LHSPVRFEACLEPSPAQRRLALASHALTAAAVMLLLPDWRGFALMLAVVALGVLQWMHRFRSGAAFIRAIRHDGSGWALRLGAAPCWHQARLLAPLFCHRHLVVLRFRVAGRWLPRTVAVTADSCSADEFRRLRVLARHLPSRQMWAASR
jgi:hypothetical protein